jgi:anti-anti-sigma factor
MTPILLSGSLDHYTVEDLKQQLLPLLEAEGKAALDVTLVEHLDASALQVLVALQQDLAKKNRGIELAGASEKLRNWMRIGGAEHMFHFLDDGR